MTRMIAAIAGSALLTVVASAALASDDQALEAAAESYIQHPVTQEMLDSMSSVETIRSSLLPYLEADGTTLSSDQIEVLSRIIQEEFDAVRPRYEIAMTNAVIETYSLEEIQALNEFYSSDVGASAMIKSGQLMRSFNSMATPIVQEFNMRLYNRLGEIFSE